jgi:hypothetical protein
MPERLRLTTRPVQRNHQQHPRPRSDSVTLRSAPVASLARRPRSRPDRRRTDDPLACAGTAGANRGSGARCACSARKRPRVATHRKAAIQHRVPRSNRGSTASGHRSRPDPLVHRGAHGASEAEHVGPGASEGGLPSQSASARTSVETTFPACAAHRAAARGRVTGTRPPEYDARSANT